MDEFCGTMGEEARYELGDAISLEELRVAAEAATGRQALLLQACHPSPGTRLAVVRPRMEKAKLEEVIERALRNWIGICHSEACIARMQRARQRVIEQCDADYEDALQAYRQIVGKEPTTQ